jgi:hypothetical protein
MATPPPDTTWIGPAVIAAGVSAVVAIVGFIISTWTARSLHSARLDTDRELAERRSATELGLAERRFQYDRDLAERRNADNGLYIDHAPWQFNVFELRAM